MDLSAVGDERLYVCLSSSESLEAFPANTTSQFVNLLPQTLLNRHHKAFYLRVLGVALSNEVEGGGVTYARINIGELEAQPHNRAFSRIANGFAFPPPRRIGRNYAHHAFTETPFLPLKFQALSQFTVRLTDAEGNLLRLKEGPPTLIFLELSSQSMDDQFVVTCSSLQPTLFPENTLGQFTAPLPSELHLGGFEAALLQLITPPGLADMRERAQLTINDVRLEFDLLTYRTTTAFLEDVAQKIAASELGDMLTFGVMPPERRFGGQAYLGRKHRLDQDRQNMMIKVAANKAFASAMGQTVQPFDPTWLMPGTENRIYFDGLPNFFNAMPNPVALLKCDLIDTRMLAGPHAQMLQYVPLVKTAHSRRLHEPQNLVFHNTVSHPVNSISFSLINPDGSQKDLRTGKDEDEIIVSLVLRKKKGPADPNYRANERM